ncbi:MAG: type II toxin-antitoxin system VapC family toxin [Candidatus Obscuribacterales bacterium]|nr:type II toxin-antitoxin system VapC family toxin [Candidatus Obscuribacterales bacterium]
MNGYLIDTNCISELMRVSPDQRVVRWFSSVNEESLYLSVLTIGEIRKGIANIPSGKRREILSTWLDSLKERFAGRIVPVNDLVAEHWGHLSADAKRKGTPVGVIDGLIAATAIEYDFTVVSRNIDDFSHVPVSVLNPWI